MSCLYPINAWRSRRLNDNGKREIVFRRRDGYEDMALQVPCGKCAGCRADKALSWALRCYQEASQYQQNSFLTITYDDNHVPNKLVKSHLQNFIRAIRDQGKKIRYYACGEYGSATNRPHYHAIIFGTDFKNGTEFSVNETLYTVPGLSETWGKGNIVLSEYTMATGCYVAGYVAKKIGSENDDQFQLMSRKPGIGFTWLEKYWRELFNTGSIICEGKEYPIPNAYLRWLEEKIPEAVPYVTKYKAEKINYFKEMSIDKVIDQHRERRAKEVYAKQRLEHQKGKEII